MMCVSRKTYRQSRSPHICRRPPQPRPYTPTPDGFERCMRVWVHLPTDDIPIPGTEGASASPEDHGVGDHTGGITPTRNGRRRRRGGGPQA
jgi:hypothetical protein